MFSTFIFLSQVPLPAFFNPLLTFYPFVIDYKAGQESVAELGIACLKSALAAEIFDASQVFIEHLDDMVFKHQTLSTVSFCGFT